MELRKDYILDRWVILSEGRSSRPRQFTKEEKTGGEICYFCPGNEDKTPPEIMRTEKDGQWQIRVFPNKFPAADQTGTTEIKNDNIFYTFSTPHGLHEIVVETPDHEEQLYDLDDGRIKDVLAVYNNRIKALSSSAEYVVVFKNHGADAGTSLVHSHTQVMSFNKVPVFVQQEVDASKRYDSCPYCDIIKSEKDSLRRCFENSSFVAFTPYASRFNYEIWLFPKKHYRNIAELDDEEMSGLAEMFGKILGKIKELNCSYNFFLHYAPEGEELHFHFEFAPRIATWGGFELSTGATINSVSPEHAAEFYRK